MSSVTAQISVRVKVAWWVPLYLQGVVAMSILTGREPDEEKVLAWVLRGVSLVRDRG